MRSTNTPYLALRRSSVNAGSTEEPGDRHGSPSARNALDLGAAVGTDERDRWLPASGQVIRGQSTSATEGRAPCFEDLDSRYLESLADVDIGRCHGPRPPQQPAA